MTGPEPLPEGISRYGAIPRERGRGLPTAFPFVNLNGWGFAVMSGCPHEIALVWGKWSTYPTRNFAFDRYVRSQILDASWLCTKSAPHVAAGDGPSHPLPGWRKRAGVWSLRILEPLLGSSLSCWSSAPLTLSLPERLGRVVEDSPGFPAYGRLRTTSSPMWGAAPLACQGASYLRTVIVTAAVYRRFGSELRFPKEANPSP
jgi:hypothetical protein